MYCSAAMSHISKLSHFPSEPLMHSEMETIAEPNSVACMLLSLPRMFPNERSCLYGTLWHMQNVPFSLPMLLGQMKWKGIFFIPLTFILTSLTPLLVPYACMDLLMRNKREEGLKKLEPQVAQQKMNNRERQSSPSISTVGFCASHHHRWNMCARLW